MFLLELVIMLKNGCFRQCVLTILATVPQWPFFLVGLAATGISLKAESLPSRLTLDQAVHLALSAHPAIKASRHRVTGSEGLVLQSYKRPNPMLFLQTENWRFTGDPGMDVASELDLFAYVSQPIETGGKRENRRSLALQDQRIAEIEQELVMWLVRQNVKTAYWQASLAENEWSLHKENTALAHEVVEYHRKRVEEGAMAEADLIRVRLEEERLRLNERQAAVAAQRTSIRLAQAMGLTTAPDNRNELELTEAPRVEFPPGGLDQNALLRISRQNRPQVRLARANVEKARRRLRLEQSRAQPNWDVILGYKRTAGYNTLLAGVAVPIPFFDRNEGTIFFNRSEIDRAEALLEEQALNAASGVNSAVASLRRRYAMLTDLRQGMLDRAEESWMIARAAYQEGATDLLRLLDAQRSRNEVKLLDTQTRFEFQIGLVELENAVGEENLAIGLELLSVTP